MRCFYPRLAAALARRADGSARDSDAIRTEYWGVDDDQDPWRVHLDWAVSCEGGGAKGIDSSASSVTTTGNDNDGSGSEAGK